MLPFSQTSEQARTILISDNMLLWDILGSQPGTTACRAVTAARYMAVLSATKSTFCILCSAAPLSAQVSLGLVSTTTEHKHCKSSVTGLTFLNHLDTHSQPSSVSLGHQPSLSRYFPRISRIATARKMRYDAGLTLYKMTRVGVVSQHAHLFHESVVP